MKKYTLFYGGMLSNWAKCKFTYNGHTFNTSEQAMMYAKAIVFDNFEIANKILETQDPMIQKKLGREVIGYVDEVWSELRFNIVIDILIEKFSQNQKMKEYLISTYPSTLVEASPYDRIWGIGLSEDDPDALDATKWRGFNLLGFALMEARAVLIKNDKSV